MSILPFSGAIYVIQNMVSGGVYVGQTIIGANRRWSQHRRALRLNTHTNHHLQGSWSKHGEQAFEFRILEMCESIDALNAAEQHHIEHFRSSGVVLYNIKEGGCNGRQASETKAKIGAANKGKSPSAETRARIRAALIGVKQSEERKAKRSSYRPSAETKAKIGAAQKGRKASPETLAKMTGQKRSEAALANMRGHKMSETTKAKLIASRLGIKHSEAAKEKMRAASTGRVPSEATMEKYRQRRASEATKAKMSASQSNRRKKNYVFLSPEGVIVQAHTLSEMSRTHQLSLGHLSEVILGKRKTDHGWSFIGFED